MPRWSRPGNRKLVWLIALLIGLSLPVLAVAHDHDDTTGVGQVAEHCVLCHALGHKAGPPPRAGIQPAEFPTVGVRVASDPVFAPARHWHDPASSQRGPPAR